VRTYYACDGSAEYTESGGSTTPQWSKTYIYLGARLLSTLTPNGSGGEFVQYHHPDRLGTRLVTNAQDTTHFEQVTLPFGTALNAESTGATNLRFTTYDRNATTGLDYAINRHYDAQQGRFTQVDPIGMRSVSLANPQTLNLYAYCANDPINHTDPSGLGFFSFLKRLFGKVIHALKAAVVAFVTAFITGGNFRTARRDAIRAFVSDLGFRTRTWRPTGTPPTFPTGTGRPALHQIFQGTILSGLFPSPSSFLSQVNGWAGGTLLSQLEAEVDKGYGWWGPCNRSASDLMRTIRRDFSKFGNFSELLAGGLGYAWIKFDPGPIRQGRTIGITVGGVSTVDPRISRTRNMSVTVSSASTTGFTFTTNPGHVFYPGTISFSARDTDSGVNFTIKLRGGFGDLESRVGFGMAFGEFEDHSWWDFLGQVRKSCGNTN